MKEFASFCHSSVWAVWIATTLTSGCPTRAITSSFSACLTGAGGGDLRCLGAQGIQQRVQGFPMCSASRLEFLQLSPNSKEVKKSMTLHVVTLLIHRLIRQSRFDSTGQTSLQTPPDDPNDHANAGRAVSGSDGAWLSTCGHGYSGAYVHGPHACHSTYATHASHGLPASRFGARGGPTCDVGCVHVCFHGANSPCLVINAQL